MFQKAITKPAKGKKLTAETVKRLVEMYQTSKITQRDLTEKIRHFKILRQSAFECKQGDHSKRRNAK